MSYRQAGQMIPIIKSWEKESLVDMLKRFINKGFKVDWEDIVHIPKDVNQYWIMKPEIANEHGWTGNPLHSVLRVKFMSDKKPEVSKVLEDIELTGKPVNFEVSQAKINNAQNQFTKIQTENEYDELDQRQAVSVKGTRMGDVRKPFGNKKPFDDRRRKPEKEEDDKEEEDDNELPIEVKSRETKVKRSQHLDKEFGKEEDSESDEKESRDDKKRDDRKYDNRDNYKSNRKPYYDKKRY